MPTIIELFKNKELLFPGGSTAKGAVKKESETLIEQETSGIRIKSLVDINNPLIYGNEASRIVNKSTPILEDMKNARIALGGDGGLIGKGLDKLTGGKVKSIKDVRDKVNSKLGIPTTQIPSRILGQIRGQASDVPVTLTQNGTEFGKLLKESGGNPKTILKQGVGKAIGKAKDLLRGALFGKPPVIGDLVAGIEPDVNITTSETPYTLYKKSPEGGDIYSADVKTALEGTKIDLSRVSPIYGLKRKETEGRFGSTPYAFQQKIDDEGKLIETNKFSPEKQESTFTAGARPEMEEEYRLSNTGDGINTIFPADEYTMEDDAFMKVGETVYKDFIPLWFKKHGADKPVVFRAIMSGLSETTSPDWSSNKFVGNPYSFYMYGGVERSISFNIKLFAASTPELSGIWSRLKILTSYAYPTITGGVTTPPIIQFRIGSIYSGKAGFIESLQYTIPDESNWETDKERGGYLPKMVDVSIGIKFIETHGDEERLYDMDISKKAAKGINEGREDEADMEAERTGNAASEVVKEKSKKEITTVSVLKSKGVELSTGIKSQAKNITSKLKDTHAGSTSAINDMFYGGLTPEEYKAQKLKQYNDYVQTQVTSILASGYTKHKGTHKLGSGLLIYTKPDGDKGHLSVTGVNVAQNGIRIGPFRTKRNGKF